jgi:hypothetical protein
LGQGDTHGSTQKEEKEGNQKSSDQEKGDCEEKNEKESH